MQTHADTRTRRQTHADARSRMNRTETSTTQTDMSEQHQGRVKGNAPTLNRKVPIRNQLGSEKADEHRITDEVQESSGRRRMRNGRQLKLSRTPTGTERSEPRGNVTE